MGKYFEKVTNLRKDETVHYNCAQAVLVGFSDQMGYSEEQAFLLGANLGSGMRHGSACGAMVGALLVLGALGYDETQAREVVKNFRHNHGSSECRDLLRTSVERGETKKEHCDGLVFEMTRVIESLVENR